MKNLPKTLTEQKEQALIAKCLCPKCRGNGNVTIQSDVTNGYYTCRCPECNGTGTIRYEP